MRYAVDHAKLSDLIKTRKYYQAVKDYYWEQYCYLEKQRRPILDSLKEALITDSAADFKFDKWQRAVKYKYSLHPLCTNGSLTDPGGRFNIGDIDPSSFQKFPALYLAQNKETALQELLTQGDEDDSGFTSLETSLTASQSISIISLSGFLDKVIDLRNTRKITKFVNLIKSFKYNSSIYKMAKKLNFNKPSVVKTPKLLLETLLDPNWRNLPMGVDIPANSQIFGKSVFEAGVEGILYKSKLTNKECLAIFPHNFPNSDSYIELDDESPHPKTPVKVDASNWQICDKFAKEIIHA